MYGIESIKLVYETDILTYTTIIMNLFITVVLDEDEVYHVLSKYDESMSGKLDYKKFLRDNVSRAGSRSSFA